MPVVDPLIISDFDGCIVKEKGSHIDNVVSQTLSELNKEVQIIIVTARATEKSKREAREMLRNADLGHIPVFFRDLNVYDNSPTGLMSYKAHIIKSFCRNRFIPIIGIGDNETDDRAYYLANVRHVVRIRWGDSVAIHPQSRIIEVKESNLGVVWSEIYNYFERIGRLHGLKQT